MREIKFRGKSLDNEEWIYGDLYHTNELTCICDWSIHSHTVENFSVDPSTVGQFTGLLDKNGKEICEGDIVDAVAMADFASKTCISDVFCSIEDSSQFCIRAVLNGVWKRYIKFGLHIRWGGWASLEVIGNIHDNTKLLK